MPAPPESVAAPCPGCGARLPDVGGPTHRYMLSSPGCWACYGEVLAREYQDPAWGRRHRLTVDAYAVQHPGEPTPQSVQSVALHLVSLCAVLEHGVAPDAARRLLAVGSKAGGFRWLPPPESRGSVTVADVRGAADPEDHAARVLVWAESAWGAWVDHHGTVEGWLRRCRGGRS